MHVFPLLACFALRLRSCCETHESTGHSAVLVTVAAGVQGGEEWGVIVVEEGRTGAGVVCQSGAH